MKHATVKPAAVPALVLCAVLMTSAEAARAGGAPVVPFPGTNVPASLEHREVKSAAASPPPLDAEAAGGQAGPGVPGAAAGDETAAPDAGAEVQGSTGSTFDAETSEAAVLEGVMTAAKPATPAGGSRLLRALAELPETPVPGDVACSGVPRVSVTSVFAAEGCPRALLRRLLAGAAGEADALSALGIEREILTLCRERQEILAGLLETDARLGELREAARAQEPQTPVTASGAVPAPRVGASGEPPAVGTAAPSPLRAAPGGTRKTVVPGNANEPDSRAAEPQAPAGVSPRYAWFSIIGTAGALRAGVTDGTGVWFVREGDPLPGGATIAAIAGRPPGVRVMGVEEALGPASGEAVLLPFGARPGGAR